MSELDKTIEELEKEVVAELDEANGKKPNSTGGKADPMPKMKDGEKPEDVGGPTPEKDANMVGKPDAAKKVKKDTSAPTKGAVPPEKADTIKEAEHEDDEEPKMKKDDEEEDDDDDMDEQISKLSKLSKTELVNQYTKGMTKSALAKGIVEYGNGMKNAMKMHGKDDEKKKKMPESVDVRKDVDALLEGEDFSDEFKTKAETIFEAAVSSRISEVKETLEEQKTQAIEEAKEDMVDKIDSYLTYVTEEWKKENQLAIERGLKGEIAEDFITGLKSLFEDHYIDVPNEKYDILEAQTKEIEELKAKVNDLMEQDKSAKNKVGELVRESLISEVSKDLAETEKEKFNSLTADVEFSDEESFKEKLSTLKESYFPSEKKVEEVLSEDAESPKTIEANSDIMAAYTAAINKTHKRAVNKS
tara:strand:- start:477 stop:1724 length:1248 start_codon:yes stop_codon:yes gene_type:complete